MLSKSTEYAIRALVFIQLENWKQRRPGVIEIAREIETPPAFTAKILQILTRHRLVQSMKGRGGGFFFTGDIQQVTLFEVIHVIEGDGLFHRCGIGLKNCSNENPCPIHHDYMKVREEMNRIVRNETIYSLATKVADGQAVLNRIPVE
ncbi:MAG: RrF2 family transcriptional regulator [Mangrovibacterium sp.]